MNNNTLSIQLFHQPSLSASYIRNSRSMNAFDCILNFSQIPLQFKLSSDISSGWCKIIYEQILMNRNQQKLEIDIQGPTTKEAFVVEECVKLLFGFKIDITLPDLWGFLKVSDLLGITQSPQNECLTIQEQLLKFAYENIDDLNIIEGWDYLINLIENGAEGLLVHRLEIRQLAGKIIDRIKEILLKSKFEILIYYAHNLENEDIQSCQINKFQIRDLKREYYIQLRSLFYNYLNENQCQLTNNQNIVKVLFEELDSQYELDSYITKYLENVNNKLSQMENEQIKLKEEQDQQIIQLNEELKNEIIQLKQENYVLKNQLLFQNEKIDSFYNQQIICQYQMKLFAYNNGIIKTQQGQITYLSQKNIKQISYLNSNIIVLIDSGDIYIFDEQLKYKTILKSLINNINVSTMHVYNNYILITFENGQLIVWWNDQQVIEQIYKASITCMYSHISLGSFIVFGDSQGLIYFVYINETKPKLAADTIKQFKNQNIKVTHIINVPSQQEMLISGHIDNMICIWNWELEQLTAHIQLKERLIDLGLTNEENLRILTQYSVQEYLFEQSIPLQESIHADENSLSLYGNHIITKDGKILELDEGPLNKSTYHLAQCSVFHHHLETCIYGLQLINYPLFASSSDDKTIVLFNLRSQDKLILRGHQGYVRALALLQGQKHLISGSYDSSIKIWEIGTGIQFNTLNGHTRPVLCIEVLQNTQMMCCSGGEDAIVMGWNWRKGICVWKIEQNKKEIWSLLNVKDFILSGNKDGSVRVIQTENRGEKSQSIQEIQIHKSYVNCMIHLNQYLIATGSSDFNIHIVNFKSGIVLKCLEGHQNIVWSIQVIDGNTIASCSTEGKIKIWDWNKGVCLNSQSFSKGSIYVLLKVPHSTKILGGTATGEVIQWKLMKQNIINI